MNIFDVFQVVMDYFGRNFGESIVRELEKKALKRNGNE